MARQTARRRHGNRAEELVARGLADEGWRVLGTQIRTGRDEIDLLAIDPGPPRELVAVEVRSASTTLFGAPEERVDGAKVRRIYRASAVLRASGTLPDGTPLPRLPWRVDLILVEMRPQLARDVGGPVLRHLRGVRPD